MRSLTIALLSTALSANFSIAQVATDADYNIEHNFTYQPAGDVVQVTGAEFRHAWIRTAGIFGSVWSAEPPAQDPLFDAFGTENFAAPGASIPAAYNSGIFGTPVQCLYNTFNIPPAGINGFQCIILPLDQSWADACTEFFVAPYSPLPPYNIQGRIAASGGIHAVNANVYAYSSAGISVRGGVQMANGTVTWNPTVSELVGAGTGGVGFTDPVHIQAINLDDGTQINASLFEFQIDSNTLGTINWNNDLFETDRPDLNFTLDIPPNFVLPGESGSLHLRIENSTVTIADDSGIFNGLLPPLGSVGPQSFLLPNNLTLNYDLNLDPAFNWDVLTDLSGGAGTLGDSSCPADLNADGALDFFDISLFLKLFANNDPIADFTNDEQFDFFDISAFLAAFTQGCDGDLP